VLCPWNSAYLLTGVFVLTSACSGSVQPTEVILRYLMLARPLNIIGPSRLWVPLLVTVSHLKSALFHGICPASFTSSLTLLFSPWHGLRVVTLKWRYVNFIDRYGVDRNTCMQYKPYMLTSHVNRLIIMSTSDLIDLSAFVLSLSLA